MELRNTFELSAFDRLSEDEFTFLLTFLRKRGNLKKLQEELCLSYPAAQKKLDRLLRSLGLMDEQETTDKSKEEMDMTFVREWKTDPDSVKASEMIKAKLKKSGGRVVVSTVRGLPCEMIANPDGESFSSDKLPITPSYRYDVFDVIVDCLQENGGSARKGDGRKYKYGDPECDDTTVVGAIARNYFGKRYGDSTYDPVFVLAAVLEWAGIASNERGYLKLTDDYREKIAAADGEKTETVRKGLFR
jgi:hypothetical protein